EFLELDSHRIEDLARLDDGEGELPAGKKTGFFAVDRDQISLGQNLEQVLGLERLNHGANIEISASDKDIQEIADVDCGRRGGSCSRGRAAAGGGRGGSVMDGYGSELPGLDRAYRIAKARGKDIEPVLQNRGAVDLSELHLEQDLLRAFRPKCQNIDNVLRISLGDLAGTRGHGFVRDMSRKHNRRAGGGHQDLLVRENALFFFGRSGHIDIDAEIEASGTLQFVPDKQRYFARGAAVYQDLGRSYNLHVSHSRICDGNALQTFARVDEQRLSHHDAERRRPRGLRRCRDG